MGDRANIYLRDSDTSGMYVYTHWSGHLWPAALQEALKFGESRWGDEQYLSRIIVSRVFKDIADSTTGGGLSTQLGDNGYSILCVDVTSPNGIVGVMAEDGDHNDIDKWQGKMSFKEFIALSDVSWSSFPNLV